MEKITMIMLLKDISNDIILTNGSIENAINRIKNLCGELNTTVSEDAPLLSINYVLTEEHKEAIVKEMEQRGLIPAFISGSKEYLESCEESYGLNFNK